MPLPSRRIHAEHRLADDLELAGRERASGEREVEAAQERVRIERGTGGNVLLDLRRRAWVFRVK